MRKMSTPNLGDRRGEGSKAMDTLWRGLAYYTNQDTRVESSEKPNGSLKAKTVTGDRTTEATVKQPTLGHVLSKDLGQPESTQGENDILLHGPRSQGPRTFLIIHQDLQGSA